VLSIPSAEEVRIVVEERVGFVAALTSAVEKRLEEQKSDTERMLDDTQHLQVANEPSGAAAFSKKVCNCIHPHIAMQSQSVLFEAFFPHDWLRSPTSVSIGCLLRVVVVVVAWFILASCFVFAFPVNARRSVEGPGAGGGAGTERSQRSTHHGFSLWQWRWWWWR
jgi:hypothetical protein